MSAFNRGRPLPNGATPPQPAPRWAVPAICLALAAITFAVFGQTLRHEFFAFDDNDYVYENLVVSRGLTLQGVVWAFSFHFCNWHPLTWLSHELDCQFFGLHPGGHHLTNVLLHTAAAIVLFLALRRMTGALWRSAFVAAVFAVHPLRAESVAWVAERKDVLSGLFFMLAVGAYVRYVENLKSQISKLRFWHALALVFFALGLMSKPMLVTLPLALLILDYWPLQRVESAGRLVVEKLPFLALSAAAGAATVLAQNSVIRTGGSYSLPNRLGNAMAASLIYLGQMVWPARLAVFYPYPQHGIPAWEAALAGMLLAGLSALAWAGRRTRPWLLFGWAWYLVTLLPVIGIIQVGAKAHADRYTYLPQIGIYVAVTWLAAQWRMSRAAFGGLMAGVLAALMICAWKQTAYWQNSETLWARTVACTASNCVAHCNLGIALRQRGMVDQAIAQFDEALKIQPDDADSHNNLGLALRQKGMAGPAIAQYEMALQCNPACAAAHFNLGVALLQKGRASEALSHYQEALRIEPASKEIVNNLAWLLATSADASLRDGKKALELARRANDLVGGTDPVLLDTLAAALAETGQFGDAQSTAQKALALAQAAGQQSLVEEIKGEWKLYQAGLPCRQ
jgi:tetratricopeptide (TPR) repeat protein